MTKKIQPPREQRERIGKKSGTGKKGKGNSGGGGGGRWWEKNMWCGRKKTKKDMPWPSEYGAASSSKHHTANAKSNHKLLRRRGPSVIPY